MGQKNRLQKRFLEKKGEKIMEGAMVEKARSLAVEAQHRAFAWKRATQFLFILAVLLGLALAATVYTAYTMKQSADEAKSRCR